MNKLYWENLIDEMKKHLHFDRDTLQELDLALNGFGDEFSEHDVIHLLNSHLKIKIHCDGTYLDVGEDFSSGKTKRLSKNMYFNFDEIFYAIELSEPDFLESRTMVCS